MRRGIYILANDRVINNTIALINSIRVYNSSAPVIMIPYDNNCKKVAKLLSSSYNVQIYEDLRFITRLSRKIKEIITGRFYSSSKVNIKGNLLRKLTCWFGSFDEFLYIDSDIVVFENIIDNLKYLSDYDFICCDYQSAGGIKDVFTPKILEDKVFDEDKLKDVFNTGFWGSKKNLFSEYELYQILEECIAHPEYFILEYIDQTLINYIVLKYILRRFNIVRMPGKEGAGSWAGSPHFRREGNILTDPNVNQSLKFLHWAGLFIEPGCPYYDIWKYYRDLKLSSKVSLE